jgi:hypothetical protein
MLATLALVAMAIPAGAAPPERFDEPIGFGFPDFENGYAVFVNTTRADVCTQAQLDKEQAILDWDATYGDAFEQWVEDGNDPEAFEPPRPPEDYEFPAIDLVPVKGKATGKGAIVFQAKASDLHIELWVLDNGEDLGVGPCTDTDDSDTKFATGTTRYRSNDNDLFGSQTRGNAFGDGGKAALSAEADGQNYTYSWVFHVNSRCHGPEFGPPACLVQSASLR